MIWVYIFDGVCTGIIVGAIAYYMGRRAGREYETQQLVGGKLSGEVDLRFPAEDFQSLACYGHDMHLTFRRTDRIAVDVSDCKHQTLPLSALARTSHDSP